MANPATSFRVLVVEDDPALREFTTDWLAEAGYSARAAENGAEALDALGWGPDLILLDLRMPVMDGWQFLDRLTASSAHPGPNPVLPPVIVLTATPRTRAELPRGAVAMLEKPFDFDLLGRSIAKFAAAPTR